MAMSNSDYVLADPERERRKIIYHSNFEGLTEKQKTQAQKLISIDELFYDTSLQD